MAFFISIRLQVASVGFITFIPWAWAHVSDSCHFTRDGQKYTNKS